MKWRPLIKHKLIRMDHFIDTKYGFGEIGFDNILVIEVREGYDYNIKTYWVHCGNYINVFVKEGSINGIGADKYKKNIFEAIEKFKLDGIDISKVVKYPPIDGGEFYIDPAVMYDSSDYSIINFGNMKDLDKKYKGRNYSINNSNFNDETINHSDVCILKIPLDQKVVDDLWYGGKNFLRLYIESQLNNLLKDNY